ncbi:MAG: glycoside hydrolase family 2, partial [Acidobacteria bacterium]|nr:glycoside hydrolase family 2 [Acidobacteriota bacterium]
YTRTSGIWQSVWLEAVGDSYLGSVRISSSMDGAVRFDGKLVRPADDLTLRAIVSFGGAEVARGEAKAEGSRVGLGLAVSDPRQWYIGQGNLYDVTLEVLRGADVLDRVHTYYGYRQVAVDATGLQFNGRRLYLRMVLDQGYWPDSLLTPPSDEAIQFDIKTMQAMGFNGARKHQKVEDPRFLYWADKLGFLVSGEMANAYLFDEQYVARFTREWLDVIERDVNHPSIIMWIPINESWGTPNLRDVRQQMHLKANYMLTKSVDPTRLVIENDGWEHVDTTDLFGIHDYARTGDDFLRKYQVLDNPQARIPDNGRAALVPGFEYNGSPIFLSEFGGIAYRMPGSPVPEGAWGYSGVEKTADDALARLRGLYEAIRKVPRVIGVCYTQLTDVEQEINGLLTYDRKPKFDIAAIKAINDGLRP